MTGTQRREQLLDVGRALFADSPKRLLGQATLALLTYVKDHGLSALEASPRLRDVRP